MPPRPREVYRRLVKEGWTATRGKGSHRKLERAGETIILPYHAKDLSKGLWEDIRKRAGWE